MARPQYDAVAPAANVPSRSRAARVVAAAATVMFACAAVVALVGVSTQTPKSSVMAQTAVATPKASVTMLAEYFLKHGSTMTDKAALSAVKAWTSHPEMETAALMGTKDAATMMLALTPSRHMSLAEGSALCEKKDKIIALFDRLLSKLGGEELAANITYGKVDKEFKDTLATWLDAESHYRLTVEQTKEAKQGASYASDEYEKWKTAYKKAKADLEATLARHAEERTSLGEEREVIKEILRYLGVLRREGDGKVHCGRRQGLQNRRRDRGVGGQGRQDSDSEGQDGQAAEPGAEDEAAWRNAEAGADPEAPGLLGDRGSRPGAQGDAGRPSDASGRFGRC